MLRLRDEQWDRIREHFLEEHIPDTPPGRKLVPARQILNAVLWILNTGVSGTCCSSAILTTKPCTARSNSGANARCCARS